MNLNILGFVEYFRALDQGIINSFKRNYRKAVAQRYLVHIDTGCPATFNISVLEALYLMKKAWDDISTSAIAISKLLSLRRFLQPGGEL
ncbi:tigger transposable element-derived protein 6 [Plakobranchus ocellatus]|uniref:Tigger transposable element-derived protein 6 n=1 Tax=Plakobranchus ocellatus TaxID=259542 RepID=A0AAV3ZKB9_9GAST|nr:tigger transposable element-derived protein 6 [Plakobranchus ocellatus]